MSTELSKESFLKIFQELGLKRGDFLLVHSAIEGISPIESIHCFNALLEIVGDEGTIAFPTFNFGFCQGLAYDQRRTPSQVGMLTEMARRHPKAKRILHPIYSFALFGKQSEELSHSIKNVSAFSEDSLFGELKRQDGKILLIQLPFNKSMTFLHHIEEIVGVDYRYIKTFEGDVIDFNGVKTHQSCKMLVRNLEMGVETYVDEIQKRLEDLAVIKCTMLKDKPIRLMSSRQIFDAVSEIMKSEPHIMAKINKPKA